MQLGGLNLGIDSIIYTIFIYCVFLTLNDYHHKDTWTLMYSTLGSLIFAGFVQLIGDLSRYGFSPDAFGGFVGFVASALGTYLAILGMQYLFKKLSARTNIFVNSLLSIVFASIVQSVVYIAVTAIFGLQSDILDTVLSSLVGKGLALVFVLITMIGFKYDDSKHTLKPNIVTTASRKDVKK